MSMSPQAQSGAPKTRTQASALAAERDDDLVIARRTAHAYEAVDQHAAPQVFGEFALDVTGQSATFGIGRAYLGEHRLSRRCDLAVRRRHVQIT